MIAADANIFVSWLVEDDKAKADAVARLLKESEEAGRQLWVSDLVMAEVVWVLQRLYRIKPALVAEMVEPLLDAPMLEFENRERLMRAVTLYGNHGVDFADCYTAAAVAERKLEGVLSYDRDFDRLAIKRMEP